jgi:predicted dinucleotide-binding enzyme
MPFKRVGILGSGQVGQTLAKGFSTIGHEVKIASRSPEKLNEWTEKEGEGKISAGTFDEVARFADLVVLATRGEATESAIDLAGPRNFDHKLVIDSTNPLDFSKGMPPGLLARYSTRALSEHVQQKLPQSSVVKCFNTVPNTMMFHPKFEHTKMLVRV